MLNRQQSNIWFFLLKKYLFPFKRTQRILIYHLMKLSCQCCYIKIKPKDTCLYLNHSVASQVIHAESWWFEDWIYRSIFVLQHKYAILQRNSDDLQRQSNFLMQNLFKSRYRHNHSLKNAVQLNTLCLPIFLLYSVVTGPAL